MKVSSASLLSGKVQFGTVVASTPPAGLAKFATVGRLVETYNGVTYRVLASVAADGGLLLRLQNFFGQTITASGSKVNDLGILSPKLANLARWMRRIAYTSDVDSYVKEAIREAGLPVDESWDWSKWFSKKFAPRLITRDPELQDEAIFQVIVNNLYDNRVLQKFVEKNGDNGAVWKNENVKNESLEKQVTMYLLKLFNWKVQQANRFIKNKIDSPADVEMVPMNQPDPTEGFNSSNKNPGGTYNVLDTLEHATTPGQEEFEFNSDTRKFRDLFYQWLKANQRKKVAGDLILMFDLILENEGESAHKTGYKEVWMKQTGLSDDSYKLVRSKLFKLLDEFISTHEDALGGESSPIVRMHKNLKKNPKSEKKPVKSSLGGLRIAVVEAVPPGTPVTINQPAAGETPPKAPAPVGQNPATMGVQTPAQPAGFTPTQPQAQPAAPAPTQTQPAAPLQMRKTVPPELPNAAAHMSSAKKADEWEDYGEPNVPSDEYQEPAHNYDPYHIPSTVECHHCQNGLDEHGNPCGYCNGAGAVAVPAETKPEVVSPMDADPNFVPEFDVADKHQLKSMNVLGKDKNATLDAEELRFKKAYDAYTDLGYDYDDAYDMASDEDNCLDCDGRGSCFDCFGQGRIGRKTCAGCNGTGDCLRCQGSGAAGMELEDNPVDDTCPSCGGDGLIKGKKCKACGGHGKTSSKEEVGVALPETKKTVASLVAKVAARRAAEIALAPKYGKMKNVAASQAKEAADALEQLSRSFAILAEAAEALRDNLNLSRAPRYASLKERVQANRDFAKTFKRMASEHPEKIGAAINDLYHATADIAEDLENMADRLDVPLSDATPEEAVMKKADKIVDWCPSCHGEEPQMSTCKTCDGHGTDPDGRMVNPPARKAGLNKHFTAKDRDKRTPGDMVVDTHYCKYCEAGPWGDEGELQIHIKDQHPKKVKSGSERPCPCGSGLMSNWEHDGKGIPLARACDKCRAEKLKKFRPEVLKPYDQNDVDEPIEEHQACSSGAAENRRALRVLCGKCGAINYKGHAECNKCKASLKGAKETKRNN